MSIDRNLCDLLINTNTWFTTKRAQEYQFSITTKLIAMYIFDLVINVHEYDNSTYIWPTQVHTLASTHMLFCRAMYTLSYWHDAFLLWSVYQRFYFGQ